MAKDYLRATCLALTLPLTTGCYSLAEQRHEHAVTWSDGVTTPLEVWIVQGSGGHPLMLPLDLIATPVIMCFETYLALNAAQHEDHRIRWGPVGWLASLLPVVTCMGMDNHLSVHVPPDALPLPAEDHARLAKLSAAESVAWLAERIGKDPRHLSATVTEVRLAQTRAP